MTTTQLQVVISFHQPLSASEEDLDRALAQCYLPLVADLEAAEGAKVALHFTGHLLDTLSRRHQDLLVRLKRLVGAGRVEILGGLFYGAPPSLLAELDVRGQLEMMAEYWESFVGTPPAGMWLPELAWSRDLPRMLDETGIEYGFVSRHQLRGELPADASLLTVSRGGQGIGAFLVDPELSAMLPSSPVDEWIDAVVGKAPKDGVGPVTAWVRAESLGLEPGTQAWCRDQGWLSSFFGAIGGGRSEVETVLPATSFGTVRPAVPVELRDGLSAELEALGSREGPVDWTDFVTDFAEVDVLYRRMLRVSDKLRDAIATMEEDDLEEDWSDVLATAQRLVFSAQAPDVWWRGPLPGFSDPALRDAVMERLTSAATMIDTLVQGEDDWIGAEEEDVDGDLVDEIFVANRHLTVWVSPAEAGAIRAIDDRARVRTVFDVGTRRREAFSDEMAQAPADEDATVIDGVPRRGAGLRRLGGELPVESDGIDRRGLRERLIELDATSGEYFGGTLATGLGDGIATIVRNEIDEEADGTYRLDTRTEQMLDGVRPRRAIIQRALSVPIDAAEVRLDYAIAPEGEGGCALAIEIPIRLGAGAHRLRVNGSPVDSVAADLADVSDLEVEGSDGSCVAIRLEPAQDTWVLPVRTAVRDLAGYRAAEQGVLLVPVVRLEASAEASIVLTLSGPEPAAD